MQHFNKDRLLEAAKERLDQIRKRITDLIPETKQAIDLKTAGLPSLDADTRYAQEAVIERLKQKIEDLGLLHPSPYFIKCIVRFDTDNTDRIFYFSKLPLTEEDIYSWTAPAAVLRFMEPGEFSYSIPGGSMQSGQLLHKEQYLITNGHILFMAAENTEHGRELIYQEHFSKRKTDFLLPEVIEQLEAAQDKAIRTPASENLLISGPAGSGKTTLALHRIAYLLQAPETAERFKAEDAIVFVNDHNTKTYFSSLLPQLGIHSVTITTFADFARLQLGLLEIPYQERANVDPDILPLYEHAKLQALRSNNLGTSWQTDPFLRLKNFYGQNLSAPLLREFLEQAQQGYLDRIDMVALLVTHIATHGPLQKTVTHIQQHKEGRVRRKKTLVPLSYTLVVLDEVQNYLPEQLRLLQNLTSKFGSRMYVGDLAQQTKLFTIRSWDQVNESFSAANTVTLEKVYRSTRQILEYIRSLGFPVHVPQEARNGAPVEQHILKNNIALYNYIDLVVAKNEAITIGILANSSKDLEVLAEQYKTKKSIRVLTIGEAQGVEFDIVCLLNPRELLEPVTKSFPTELAEQVQQVQKDLLYVALTRAMNELHILEVNDTLPTDTTQKQ